MEETLAGQRSPLELYRQDNLFPGFRGGFTTVARDESRHVLFGVKFLRDMIQQDATYTKKVYAAIEHYAPVAIMSLMPLDDTIPAILAMRADPWMMPRYVQDSLREKLRVIGLSVEMPFLPALPPFAE